MSFTKILFNQTTKAYCFISDWKEQNVNALTVCWVRVNVFSWGGGGHKCSRSNGDIACEST